MNSRLRASYQHCRRITRRSGSSFYYSFLLLPKPKRRAMYALYAFLRRTDDLSDNPLPADLRRGALGAWRGSLERSLVDQYDDPILPALADSIRVYGIPLEYLHDAIDGVEMDLEPRLYRTFADLEQYCYRVASAVGLACLRIWGSKGTAAQQPARICGLAFQMTNILRDLKEDAACGRVYLPVEDLERFGYSADDLRAGVRDERFRRLMQFEIERTEKLFAEAAELEDWLEPDTTRVFASMVGVYRALLDEIKRRDGDVLSTRIRLSSWRKMRIATRHLLFRPAPLRPAGIAAR